MEDVGWNLSLETWREWNRANIYRMPRLPPMQHQERKVDPVVWNLEQDRWNDDGGVMAADKMSGMDQKPAPLIKDKDGNIRDQDGNKVRTALEEQKLQRGKAAGGLCGYSNLCSCNSTHWSVGRQCFMCKGCYDDYVRLWGGK